MTDNVTNKAYTITQPEFNKFSRVAAKGKPDLDGWSVSEFNGWLTVTVPNWGAKRSSFFKMLENA